MENWKTNSLARTYLEGVRGAIPFAGEQLEIILRIIRFFKPEVNTFLDLGCGDGILGRTLLADWPASRGLFLDFSEPMIKEAQVKNTEYPDRAAYVVQDFGESGWLESIANELPVDVVISGFSIHHLQDEKKLRIYQEIHNRILKPGGIFLNLDQVKSPTLEIESLFNGFFMDRMRESQKEENVPIPIGTIEEEFYKDKKINILASVEKQCDWLRKIGFIQVDCYFKAFELSIFGGLKPE